MTVVISHEVSVLSFRTISGGVKVGDKSSGARAGCRLRPACRWASLALACSGRCWARVVAWLGLGTAARCIFLLAFDNTLDMGRLLAFMHVRAMVAARAPRACALPWWLRTNVKSAAYLAAANAA